MAPAAGLNGLWGSGECWKRSLWKGLDFLIFGKGGLGVRVIIIWGLKEKRPQLQAGEVSHTGWVSKRWAGDPRPRLTLSRRKEAGLSRCFKGRLRPGWGSPPHYDLVLPGAIESA